MRVRAGVKGPPQETLTGGAILNSTTPCGGSLYSPRGQSCFTVARDAEVLTLSDKDRRKERIIRPSSSQMSLIDELPTQGLQDGLYECLLKALLIPILIHARPLLSPQRQQLSQNFSCKMLIFRPLRFEGEPFLEPVTGEQLTVSYRTEAQ